MPQKYVLDAKSAAWVAKQSRQRTGTDNRLEPQFREEAASTLQFYNDSLEEVPAFGIVRVQGYVLSGGRRVLKVKKPGVSDTGPGSWFAANGQHPVPVGEYGVLQGGNLVLVQYDSGDSPGVRDWYGIDGWKARSYPNGKPYFQVLIESVVDSTNKIAWARLIPFTTLMIKAPSGGIPGRVGSLLGGANCAVVVRSTSTEQLSTSTLMVRVLNWATASACTKGDRYGLASMVDGKWLITAEDCSDTGSTVQSASTSGTVTTPADPLQLDTPITVRTFVAFQPVTWYGAGVGGGFG